MSGFDKFGKLLKYDLLESIYSVLAINGILLVLIAITRLVAESDNATIALIFGFIVPISFFASIVFLTIVIVRLLYNRIFTSDGYLTFALPVSLDAILLSKILISTLYICLSFVVVFAWVILLGIGILETMGGISRLMISLNNALAGIIISILGVIGTNVLILLILAILHIGTITRFKILYGIVLFMLFTIAESIVYGILFGSLKYTYITEVLLVCGIAFNIFKIAIYYFLTRYLIANKLEI